MEMKCESLEVFFFFFQRYNMCFVSEFFFVLVKFYSISPVLLLQLIKKKRFVSSSIDHLLYSITSSLEKEIIVLEKSQEKVLNFDAKNQYEPWGQFVLTPLK